MAVIVVIRHLYLSDSDGRKRISRQMGHVLEQWPEWGAIIISLRALTAMPCAVENGGNGYRAYGATVHPGNPRMWRMPNVILPALSITPSVSVSSPTSITGACRTR